MQGVRAGEEVEVDASDEHIAKLIRAKLLVRVGSSDSKEGDPSVNDEA